MEIVLLLINKDHIVPTIIIVKQNRDVIIYIIRAKMIKKKRN